MGNGLKKCKIPLKDVADFKKYVSKINFQPQAAGRPFLWFWSLEKTGYPKVMKRLIASLGGSAVWILVVHFISGAVVHCCFSYSSQAVGLLAKC